MDPNNDRLDREVQNALDPNASVGGDNPANLVRDPVCGNMVDKRTAADTLTTPDGGMIYFDSPECKRLYEENPDPYRTH